MQSRLTLASSSTGTFRMLDYEYHGHGPSTKPPGMEQQKPLRAAQAQVVWPICDASAQSAVVSACVYQLNGPPFMLRQ